MVNDLMENPTENIFSSQTANVDDREEGEIVDDFEYIISSDEALTVQKRIAELESKNDEIEKIDLISRSFANGYDCANLNEIIAKFRTPSTEYYHHFPRSQLNRTTNLIRSSSSESEMGSISLNRKEDRKRRKVPIKNPLNIRSTYYKNKNITNNNHFRNDINSKRYVPNKKRRQNFDYKKFSPYVDTHDESTDDYLLQTTYNGKCKKEHKAQRLNFSKDHEYNNKKKPLKKRLNSLTNRVHKCYLQNSLKDSEDTTKSKELVQSSIVSPMEKKTEIPNVSEEVKTSSNTNEKSDSQDEEELRLIALKSAMIQRHLKRKRRNAELAYSPTDFDEMLASVEADKNSNLIFEVDLDESITEMEISPTSSPKLSPRLSPIPIDEDLSDRSVEFVAQTHMIDTKSVDMDIVNTESDSENIVYSVSNKMYAMTPLVSTGKDCKPTDLGISMSFNAMEYASSLQYRLYVPDMQYQLSVPPPPLPPVLSDCIPPPPLFCNYNEIPPPPPPPIFIPLESQNDDVSDETEIIDLCNDTVEEYIITKDMPAIKTEATCSIKEQQDNEENSEGGEIEEEEALRALLLSKIQSGKSIKKDAEITKIETTVIPELKIMQLNDFKNILKIENPQVQTQTILKEAVRRLKMISEVSIKSEIMEKNTTCPENEVKEIEENLCLNKNKQKSSNKNSTLDHLLEERIAELMRQELANETSTIPVSEFNIEKEEEKLDRNEENSMNELNLGIKTNVNDIECNSSLSKEQSESKSNDEINVMTEKSTKNWHKSNSTKVIAEKQVIKSNSNNVVTENQVEKSNSTNVIAENQVIKNNSTNVIAENQVIKNNCTNVIPENKVIVNAKEDQDSSKSISKSIAPNLIVATKLNGIKQIQSNKNNLNSLVTNLKSTVNNALPITATQPSTSTINTMQNSTSVNPFISTVRKIVKPNKIINKNLNLKRKNVETLPNTKFKLTKLSNAVETATTATKTATGKTSRLVTSSEIFKPIVQKIIINLQTSDSDKSDTEEGKNLSDTKQTLASNTNYVDNASPLSLPMDSRSNTPIRVNSPTASIEKTVVNANTIRVRNDIFEQKLENFLKTIRDSSKANIKDNHMTSTTINTRILIKDEKKPLAVRHLPVAAQQEYSRLIERMKVLEKQRESKDNVKNGCDKQNVASKNMMTNNASLNKTMPDLTIQNNKTISKSNVTNKNNKTTTTSTLTKQNNKTTTTSALAKQNNKTTTTSALAKQNNKAITAPDITTKKNNVISTKLDIEKDVKNVKDTTAALKNKTIASKDSVANVTSNQTTTTSSTIKANTATIQSQESKKRITLRLQENSYHKSGAIILNKLDSSLKLVNAAKTYKIAEIKYERQIKALVAELEEAKANLKKQKEKLEEICPEVCRSNEILTNMRKRRLKLFRAASNLGKSIIGENYSLNNELNKEIKIKFNDLAKEIKVVNSINNKTIDAFETNQLTNNEKLVSVDKNQHLSSKKDEQLYEPIKHVSSKNDTKINEHTTIIKADFNERQNDNLERVTENVIHISKNNEYVVPFMQENDDIEKNTEGVIDICKNIQNSLIELAKPENDNVETNTNSLLDANCEDEKSTEGVSVVNKTMKNLHIELAKPEINTNETNTNTLIDSNNINGGVSTELIECHKPGNFNVENNTQNVIDVYKSNESLPTESNEYVLNDSKNVCSMTEIQNFEEEVPLSIINAAEDINAPDNGSDEITRLPEITNNETEDIPICFQQYASPLARVDASERMDPDIVFCPYELMGSCADLECKFNHFKEHT